MASYTHESYVAELKENAELNFHRRFGDIDYDTNEEIEFGYDRRMKIRRKGKTIAIYSSLPELINDLGRCKNEAVNNKN